MEPSSHVSEDGRAGPALRLPGSVLSSSLLQRPGGLFCHPRHLSRALFPGSLRTDFRFHWKNLQVFQKLESFVSRASFIFHLFFAILDLGTGSLNLLFLALHSIDPYLLGGWGLAFPPPHRHRWTSALSKSPRFHWVCAKPVRAANPGIQHPPGGATTPPPPQPGFCHISLQESAPRAQPLLTSLFSPPEAVVIEVRGILNFLPRSVLYFSTL